MAKSKKKHLDIEFDPKDTFLFNEGTTDFLKHEGDAWVTVNDGARLGTLKVIGDGGHLKTVLNGTGRIDLLSASGADMELLMNDSSRARVIQYSGGTAEITTDTGYIAYVETWRSTNILETGTGSIGALSMGSDTGEFKHKITTNGWIGDLRIGADQVVLKVGDGGAGSISLSNQKDIVTTGSGGIRYLETGGGNDVVKIGSGFVQAIALGAGNDKITTTSGGIVAIDTGTGDDKIKTGAGQVNFLETGAGNDKIAAKGGIVKLDGGTGNDLFKVHSEAGFFTVSHFDGGSGVDTIDFSKAKQGLEFKFDTAFHFNDSVGLYSTINVENMKGSKFSDVLIGNEDNNRITGGNGNDRLEGGGGDDILFGNGGKDVFVFGHLGGNDQVKGYQHGVDLIEIIGHVGGFDGLTISGAKVTYDGGSITLIGHHRTVFTESDFDFG